jgi:hypothetical protein
LARAKLLDADELHILAWRDTLSIEWTTIVSAAIAEARRVEARLLIVDTLPQWARLAGDSENQSGAALAALAPLQEAAAIHGLAVLIVRHDRKSGGDLGVAARGSSAFGGAVDILLQLKRPDGSTRPSIRSLHGIGRFDGVPDALMVEWDAKAGIYSALGDERTVSGREARRLLVGAAPNAAEHAQTLEELTDGFRIVKRTVAYAAATGAVSAGELAVLGEGERNDPFRYYRPAPLEAAPPDADEMTDEAGADDYGRNGERNEPDASFVPSARKPHSADANQTNFVPGARGESMDENGHEFRFRRGADDCGRNGERIVRSTATTQESGGASIRLSFEREQVEETAMSSDIFRSFDHGRSPPLVPAETPQGIYREFTGRLVVDAVRGCDEDGEPVLTYCIAVPGCMAEDGAPPEFVTVTLRGWPPEKIEWLARRLVQGRAVRVHGHIRSGARPGTWEATGGSLRASDRLMR